MLDKRSHKQNNSLLNIVTKFFPESNQTPAPALIVLNDAMFTESDWKKLTEPPLNLDDTVSLKFGTGFFATYRFSGQRHTYMYHLRYPFAEIVLMTPCKTH